MLWFLNMLLSGKWSNLKPLNCAWHLVWWTGSCFLVLFWRNSPNDSIQSHLQTCLVLHHKKGRSNIKPETQSLAKVKKESFFWNLSHTPDESSRQWWPHSAWTARSSLPDISCIQLPSTEQHWRLWEKILNRAKVKIKRVHRESLCRDQILHPKPANAVWLIQTSTHLTNFYQSFF